MADVSFPDFNADYYNPKTMAGVIKRTRPVQSFFRKFFPIVQTFHTQTVSFEIDEQQHAIAPFYDRHNVPPSLERGTYDIRTYTMPDIGISRSISPDDGVQKLIGENAWNSGETEASRAMKIAANDIADMMNAIHVREELMCARVKQDGKLVIKGDDVETKTIDFGFEAAGGIVNIARDAVWGPKESIIDQLTDYSRIMKRNGWTPTQLIMGIDALDAFRKNEEIKELLDNRRLEYGNFKPEATTPDGSTYYGTLRVPGAVFDIYSYEGWSLTDDKDPVTHRPLRKPLLDPETVILQSPNERNYMLYGAITVKEGESFVTREGQYVPTRWTQDEPPCIFAAIKSRPLPLPKDLTSWMVLKHTVTGVED